MSESKLACSWESEERTENGPHVPPNAGFEGLRASLTHENETAAPFHGFTIKRVDTMQTHGWNNAYGVLIMKNLDDHFRANPIAACVVWFRKARLSEVISLLEYALANYRLYSATNAEGAHLFDQILARSFSCLIARSSLHYWIAFYSEEPPLFRPRFLFTPMKESSFDVKLYFDLCDFPDPPPIAHLLDTFERFATLLGSNFWSVHHEINDQWKSGDFSESTLIVTSQDRPNEPSSNPSS